MLLPSNRDSTVDVEAFSSTEGHPCQIINLRKVVQIFVVFCRPVNLPGPKSGTWTRVLEFLDLQILHEEARLPGEMFLKAYGSCSLRTTCCVLALLECVYIQNMLHKCSGMLSHHVCLGFGGLWLACESLSETCSEAKLWDVRMGAPAALNASPRIKDKGSGFQNHASNFVGLG